MALAQSIFLAYEETIEKKWPQYSIAELYNIKENTTKLTETINSGNISELPGVYDEDDLEELRIVHNMYLEQLDRYIDKRTNEEQGT